MRKKLKKNRLEETIPFSEMTPSEKSERIKYLWFRVRVISLVNHFIHMMQKSNQRSQQMKQFSLKVHFEDLRKPKVDPLQERKKSPGEILLIGWFWALSVVCWFNTITTPVLILWP